MYGQGNCSWKEGHYFDTSSNIHQENYSGDRQEAGSREHDKVESSQTTWIDWCIEVWIHSQRRNRLDQKLVEKLVRSHTNLVLRESLDDTLRDLSPWDIEFVIDEPVDEKEEESSQTTWIDWCIEVWIHSQRRNRLDQKLVEKLVRSHTNLVLRESLDDALRDLSPWDIEFVIDEPVDEKEEEPEA